MTRVQNVALIFAIVCGALGLATSTGCPVLPESGGDPVAPLHGLVILVGSLAGVIVTYRTRRIDEERWRAVADPVLTKGEREYAHGEAEREKKTAGIVFVMGPLTLGFWMAYHFGQEEAITAADFLTVTPLAGFGVGLAVGSWLNRGRGLGPDTG